jgi:hypothetical protein
VFFVRKDGVAKSFQKMEMEAGTTPTAAKVYKCLTLTTAKIKGVKSAMFKDPDGLLN